MTQKKKLLIATHNKAKFDEMRSILKDVPYELVSLSDCGIIYDVEETGVTYEENATLKAQTYAKLSGLLALADDSGLEIAALGGEPGVYSARYAGEDKTDMQKVEFILGKLKDVPSDKRQARFCCVVALAHPDGSLVLYSGEVKGRITIEPRGELEPGFPYKLIFEIPHVGKTLAELQDESEKYALHRVIALEKVIEDLKDNN